MMPVRAGTACPRSGCPGIVRAGVCTRCGPLKHERTATHDAYRGTAAERGYDRRWRNLRTAFLADHPLCVACERRGEIALATDVDHIVPRRWGGLDESNNLQPLCHICHSQKTERETRRGRWRGQQVANVIMVGGPPGAGKTHYVRQHMGKDDVVVDVDALISVLSGRAWYHHTQGQLQLGLDVREFLLLRLRQPVDIRTAWVITSAATPEERGDIAEQCGATQTIMLLEPAHVCVARIRQDERRAASLPNWHRIIYDWWRDYKARPGEEVAGE